MNMLSLRFRAVMKITGANPYVTVSKKRAHALKTNWRKPMPVLVQINDKPDAPWHINMMPQGNGDFYLYLHGNVRKASKTKVGDTVNVALGFDTAYHGGPMTPLPAWFRVPLLKSKKAERAWNKLSPSRKKEITRYFFSLKSKEAQERNLAKALRALSGESERFMGRSWINGV